MTITSPTVNKFQLVQCLPRRWRIPISTHPHTKILSNSMASGSSNWKSVRYLMVILTKSSIWHPPAYSFYPSVMDDTHVLVGFLQLLRLRWCWRIWLWPMIWNWSMEFGLLMLFLWTLRWQILRPKFSLDGASVELRTYFYILVNSSLRIRIYIERFPLQLLSGTISMQGKQIVAKAVEGYPARLPVKP